MKVDLTNCDREPIHILGAIQPFGFLLAAQRDTEATPSPKTSRPKRRPEDMARRAVCSSSLTEASALVSATWCERVSSRNCSCGDTRARW